MITLSFPKLMSVGWSRRLIETCNVGLGCSDRDVLFDLSPVEFLAPFGVTVLSATAHGCLEAGKRCTYRRPANRKAAAYLARIGFEERLVRGGATAIPYPTSIELRHFTAIDPSFGLQLVAFMNAQSRQKLSDEAQYQLQLHMIELMTNAQDHAGSGMGFWACAQFFPSKGNLRISFVDLGRGIPTVLRGLPKLTSRTDDPSLIYYATEPGVTTRVRRPGGMGLYFMREYVKRLGGTMTIISERGRVVIRSRGLEGSRQSHPFRGTAIDILLNNRGVR